MSTRFVFVYRSFFLRRFTNFPDAHELPAPVSISKWQVFPSTFIGFIGSMPSLHASGHQCFLLTSFTCEDFLAVANWSVMSFSAILTHALAVTFRSAMIGCCTIETQVLFCENPFPFIGAVYLLAFNWFVMGTSTLDALFQIAFLATCLGVPISNYAFQWSLSQCCYCRIGVSSTIREWLLRASKDPSFLILDQYVPGPYESQAICMVS